MQSGGGDRNWACKGIKISLKTLWEYLPGVHFCTPLQKVRGYVGGFTIYVAISTDQKILFCFQAVKEEFQSTLAIDQCSLSIAH
jgi:hypothetical protein